MIDTAAAPSAPDSAAPASRAPLVFLLGVPRCGSSLLARMFDAHPRVLCVGELARIDLLRKHGRGCACGETLEACPFWGPRLGMLAEKGFRYLRFGPELFDRLRRSAGADVLVDSSKHRIWRMATGLRAPLRGSGATYVLVLRDPRGIMASNVRRLPKLFRHKLRMYRKWMARQIRFCERQGERGYVLKYEDLCRDPEGELRRLCRFVGLEFAPEMLRGNPEHHLLHTSRSGYLKGTGAIQLDERWRSELDAEQLAQVEETMRGLPLVRRHYLDEVQ